MTDVPKKDKTEATEVPPHLSRALEAAAAARTMAERIRNRDMYLTAGRARSPRPSFAKTIDAAKGWSPSISPDEELVPWHLSLCQEIVQRNWPKLRMARVFRRLPVRRESEAARPRSVAPAARAADQSATVRQPTRRARNDRAPSDVEPLSDAKQGALVSRSSIEPFAACLEQEPVPQLPSLRARKLNWDGLSRELPSKTEHWAKSWPSTPPSTRSWWRGLVEVDAPIYRGLTAGPASRSLVPVATPREALTRAAVVAGIAAPEGKAEFPIEKSSRSLIRLSSARFVRSEAPVKASTFNQSAAPVQRVSFGGWRAARRLLLISCGILGGFALGIAAGGGALLTGFNLGQFVVQLEELPRSADAPAASRNSDDVRMSGRSVYSNTGVSASSAPGEGAAAVTVTSSSLNGNAGLDESRDASPAQSASGSAGFVEPEPAEPATDPAGEEEGSVPASASGTGGPRSELSWAALYARGHRAQLKGDLVAAIRWYQEAARLNPEHPAILYDLGFLLQKQGDVKDAVIQYEKAAKLNPKNPYIYFDWARILESNNDLAGAKALYEKTATLAPQQRPGTDARRRLAAINAGTER